MITFWLSSFIAFYLFFRIVQIYLEVQRKDKLTAGIPTIPKDVFSLQKVISGGAAGIFVIFKKLDEFKNDIGTVVKVWIGPKLVLVVSEPAVAQELLNATMDKGNIYHCVEAWVGQGLFTAQVDIWKKTRKLINPTFNQKILDKYLVVFNEFSRLFAKEIGEYVGQGPVDIRMNLNMLFMRSLCGTVFGFQDDVDFVDKFRTVIHDAIKVVVYRYSKPWLQIDSLFNMTQKKKTQDKIVNMYNTLCAEVLERKEKAAQKKSIDTEASVDIGSKFKPFMDHLIEMQDRGEMSAKQVKDEVNTMIIAGVDTLLSSAHFSLILLGEHPECQQKLFEEITSVLEGSDDDLSKNDFSRLPYLDAVVKETVRLIPVAPMVSRVTDSDVKFENYTVPKDTMFICNLWAINRHKCWGEDADKFRPERWLEPETMPIPAAFAAFSLGKRGCIGKAYALMSMKSFLLYTIRKFKVSSKGIANVNMLHCMVLKPRTGHEISFELR